MEHLGIDGCVRASFAMYNTEAEIDSYIKTLQRAVMMLQ